MSRHDVDQKTGRDSSASRKHDDAVASGVFPDLHKGARFARDTFRDAARGAAVAATGFAESTYDIGTKAGARVVRQVEAQPMASALIAASLGMIAGLLLSRR